MSSVFGVNSSNNYFSNFTSNNSSSKNSASSGLSPMLSGSSPLGDFSLIQSGAYKKLLSAYYKKTSSEESEESKTEKVNLSTANSDATSLNSAVTKLMNNTVSEDNRDAIKKDLKSVVEKYNAVIDSASKVDSTSVLRQALWMTQSTSANGGILSDIGITIGEGNKLSFDEEKFDKAMLTNISSAITGRDSFMGRLANRSNLIASASLNAVSGSNTATPYKSNGQYANTTSGNIVDTLF